MGTTEIDEILRRLEKAEMDLVKLRKTFDEARSLGWRIHATEGLAQRKTVYRICKALLSVPHSMVADALAYAKAEEIVEAEDSVFSRTDY